MPIGWQWGQKLRIAALTVGSAATLAIVIVGCSTVTGGTARVDPEAAPVYRASVSASIDVSKSSSAARETERQASLTKKAVHTVCEDLSTSTVDAVTAVNAYVEAVNKNSDDVQTKAGPAVDALNRSADLVNSGLADSLSADLRAALTEWVNAARAVANAISSNSGPDDFNAASSRSNTARDNALARCDAAY